jgi:HlyD family secretion protein
MGTPVQPELRGLRIDREKKSSKEPSKWATRWIVSGIVLLLLLGAARLVYGWLNSATEVETVRVRAVASSGGSAESGPVILNATGYVIAAHKIELAAKVVGKVLWIGVEKGDHVRQGQVLVRLEDDEYRAQEMQAKGNLLALDAHLSELKNGSRPEEIQRASADLESARADLVNAKVTIDRTRQLVKDGVMAQQALDDAKARYDGQAARAASLERTYQLAKIGPRQEQIDAGLGQIEQAKGQLAFAETQLANTVIKAPVSGTILERNVEKGEFVTTGFVGDKGAKGYVVSIADLNDLQVELDINQNDFGKLGPKQKGIVTTDAYPDRKYEGYVYEVSPEANRQKATVQVKVKIEKPDDYLRPEMNASVAFVSEPKSGAASSSMPALYVPAAAVRDGAVLVVAQGRVVKRAVKTGGTTAQGLRIDEGLIGGEDVIVNAPADLKEGAKVRSKEKS